MSGITGLLKESLDLLMVMRMCWGYCICIGVGVEFGISWVHFCNAVRILFWGWETALSSSADRLCSYCYFSLEDFSDFLEHEFGGCLLCGKSGVG